MKLIFEYHWMNDENEGTDTIPFEYSSKEDFQLMVLEKIEGHKKIYNEFYKNGYIKLFNSDFNVGNLEDCIEHGVFEFEEWFDKRKKVII